jgi:uncharacterized cupin superfamily protein
MAEPNLYSPEWELDAPDSPLRGRAVRLGAAAGARDLGVSLYELGTGGAVSPYHSHLANEELLIVLSGRPLLRTPSGSRELEPGAVVSFPAGREGAHRVANLGEEPARVLLVSTMRFPEIAEHLTTGTVLAITGPGQGKTFAPGTDTSLIDQLTAAMTADLEIDQRATSTT